MKEPSKKGLLSLTNDLVFKRYFKSDKRVLKSLLQAFLPLPKGQKITDISLLDTDMPPFESKGKLSVLDLRLQLNTGEVVNVEMQAFPQKAFLKRALLYWAKLYTASVKEGMAYKSIFPAWTLIFADFNMFGRKEDYLHTFSIRSDKPPHFVFEREGALRIIVVELNKFAKRDIGSLLDRREEWCYLLKKSGGMNEEKARQLSLKGEEMKTAVRHLLKLSKDDKLRMIAEAKEKEEMDRISFIQDGYDEGWEKGMQKKQREVVLNMLKEKVDISLISKVTGLTEEEIKKCQNSFMKNKA